MTGKYGFLMDPAIDKAALESADAGWVQGQWDMLYLLISAGVLDPSDTAGLLGIQAETLQDKLNKAKARRGNPLGISEEEAQALGLKSADEGAKHSDPGRRLAEAWMDELRRIGARKGLVEGQEQGRLCLLAVLIAKGMIDEGVAAMMMGISEEELRRKIAALPQWRSFLVSCN